MDKRYSLLQLFCLAIIIICSAFIGYWWQSHSELKKSNERIVDTHIKHLSLMDSLFCDLKSEILINDKTLQQDIHCLLDSVSNSQIKNHKQLHTTLIQAINDIIASSRNVEFTSKFQKDSILCQHEILMAHQQVKNMLSLHIDKIDDDYAMIGLWGTVLSIIFILFGFFAIFKIEEAKEQAKNILLEVQAKGEEVIANMTNKAESLQNLIQNVTSQNEQFNQNNQKMNILIEGFNEQKNESEQIIALLSDKLKELDLYLQDKKIPIKMKQSKKGAKS